MQIDIYFMIGAKGMLILIEPQWNVDKQEGGDKSIVNGNFNRTIVECRYVSLSIFKHVKYILIEPQWNVDM